MSPRPVLTKIDFVKRFMEGEFGNRSPTWNSVKDFLLDECEIYNHHEFHLRNRVKGGHTWYNLSEDEVITTTSKAYNLGYSDKDLYVSAMCPTHKTTFQGEVQHTDKGLYIFGSTVPRPMRESLRLGGKEYWRLTASIFLQQHMNQKSLDWLYYLLGAYPNHVIEFTCLSKCWGTEPGHNTLFWEVRGGY